MSELDALKGTALAQIAATENATTLEAVRVHWLGKKGELTERLKTLGTLPPAQRPLAGQAINALKHEKSAVILAHNYMTPEIFHGVGDYVGDSLGLAREAAKSDARLLTLLPAKKRESFLKMLATVAATADEAASSAKASKHKAAKSPKTKAAKPAEKLAKPAKKKAKGAKKAPKAAA